METELAHALDNNEFELHYQPQFDLENCVVEGVEALIRWRHPERGMVSPFHFIPVAEDAGLLPAIGQWVIREAAQQSARWKNDFGLHLRMSVNVSAHQFLHGDLVKFITDTLQREKLDPASFEIEITESVAMAEIDLVVSKLNALHDLGIRIALDDFGTGYSSLSYLQDLPLDTLKIDRSFITKIDNGTRTQRLLLESIASMAQRLEFHTVAEGVETDDQLRQVQLLGIDTVQGYYYSKPVQGDQIPEDVRAIDHEHCKQNRKAA
jgi:EAL domain-containing protein (putative c-di-GMP-specific phosphodiesterase class I)